MIIFGNVGKNRPEISLYWSEFNSHDYETYNARASLCTGSACSEDEQRDLRLPLWKAFADLCEQPEQPDRGDALRGDAARRDRSQGRWGHFQQCRPGLEPYLLFPDADSRAAADARETAAKLTEAFGSVEAFKEQFTKAAVGLFGSGWAWLAMDKAGKLSIVAKPNAGNPMTDGLRPVMTVDVWEHAYYIDYRNRRPDFLAAFWELIDWQKVADRCIPKRYQVHGLRLRLRPGEGRSRDGHRAGDAVCGDSRRLDLPDLQDSTRLTSRLSMSKSEKTLRVQTRWFFCAPGLAGNGIRRRTFRFSVRPAVPDAARGS